MAEAGDMSDDPSEGGEGEGEEDAMSPRPTARLEDFVFDPAGGWAARWTWLAAGCARTWTLGLASRPASSTHYTCASSHAWQHPLNPAVHRTNAAPRFCCHPHHPQTLSRWASSPLRMCWRSCCRRRSWMKPTSEPSHPGPLQRPAHLLQPTAAGCCAARRRRPAAPPPATCQRRRCCTQACTSGTHNHALLPLPRPPSNPGLWTTCGACPSMWSS